MDKIQMELFEQLTGLHEIPAGAYNIRANSKKDSRNTTSKKEAIFLIMSITFLFIFYNSNCKNP